MSVMTGGDALTKSLAREGVEVIFGLPGVQVLGIVDALYRNKEIRWVTVRHEQTAAYMAYGYARTTGKEGVAVVVPGPGALNATAALGTAYAASTPVLLISGQIESYNLGQKRNVLHELDDQLDVFRVITKWCHRVMTVEEIPEAVQQAMYQLRTGRPRPVELEVPFDLLQSSAAVELLDPLSVPVSQPDASKIKTAAQLLASAKRPLIWAGGGVITGDSSAELTRLAENINAPVIMTNQSKGAIPGDHPLFLGVTYNGPSAASWALSQSDVVLVVGSRFAAGRSAWQPHPDRSLIRIDIDPAELDRHSEVNLGIVADSRIALTALLKELPDSSQSTWQSSELASVREKIARQLEETAPLQTAILRSVNDILLGEGILVPDVTNLGYWCHPVCPVSRPRSSVTTSYFGTLGYAFPTALGAKLGNPERPVVAICGDGGFLFAAQDLATAVQEGINLIALVFVDGAFGTCIRDQKRNFEGRTFGASLHNPDFARFAETFGARGIKLSSHEELGDALQSAMVENRPTVIEIPVPSMVVPWEVPART